jgi:hypothetical protein
LIPRLSQNRFKPDNNKEDGHAFLLLK